MKEIKISLLLLISLSLLLLAFVVLFIWGFTYYKQSISMAVPQERTNTIVIKDASTIASGTRDSLQEIYSSTMQQLNTELDYTRVNVDSLQENIDARFAEFNTLKNEINTILQNRNSSSSDLGIARQKIAELQNRVDDWRRRHADVSEENKRLSRLLAQLNREKNEPATQTSVPVSAVKPATDRPLSLTAFSINDLQVKAVRINANDAEQETSAAEDAEKWKGSFELSNPPATLARSEMYVVVLQPDGKLMRSSAWESGTFETGEGRKIYSCKLVFDCNKGENKRLSFSLGGEQYQKGNYIFRVYHAGKLIARATKSLS